MKLLVIISSLLLVCVSGFSVSNCLPPGLKSRNCDDWVEWMESNSHEIIVFPHEFDCTRWYQCQYGIFTENHCPKGSRFDPFAKGCYKINNVECINFMDYSRKMEKRVGKKNWMVHY